MTFYLCLCEVFNEELHGFDEQSDPNVHSHLIVQQILNPNEKIYIKSEIKNIKKRSQIIATNDIFTLNHPIRNYKNILLSDYYNQLHIAKIEYLTGEECVAIIKTFWIKWIQRAWKKYFLERKNILQNRMSLNEIRYFEINGKWSQRLPSIVGLLWN